MNKKLGPNLKKEKQYVEESIHFNGEILIIDDNKSKLKLAANALDLLKTRYQIFNSIDLFNSTDWKNEISLVFIDYQLLNKSIISIFTDQKKKNPRLRIIGLARMTKEELGFHSSSENLNDLVPKPTNHEEFLTLFTRYSSSFNLTQLKTLIDDPIELSAIIDQFKSESQNDIDQLRIHLDENQTEQILHYVHRLAGRISQFGGLEFSSSLKSIENVGRKTKVISEKTKMQIKELIENIEIAFHTI